MTDGADFKDTEFKELCSSIRHFSGLRYLIIPIFLTLQGAIVLALKDDLPAKLELSQFRYVLLALPITLGGIFLILERTLNNYIDGFVNAAKIEWPNSYWTRVERTRNVVTLSISAIYVVVTGATCILLWAALSSTRIPLIV